MTLPSDSWPAPSVPALVVYTLLIVWLVAIRSRRGIRELTELSRAPDTQAAMYRRMMLRWWSIATGVLLVLLADGVTPGLGTPDGPRALRLVRLVAASLLVSAMVATFSPRVRAFYRRQAAGQGLVAALLPRTAAAAVHFVPVAITAGVCEELIFRGLVPYWTRHLAQAVGIAAAPWLLVIVSAGTFGAMHAYQGWRGVVLTGALGGLLVLLTAATGSLLPAIAVHVLIDLRVALLFRVWRELPAAHDETNGPVSRPPS